MCLPYFRCASAVTLLAESEDVSRCHASYLCSYCSCFTFRCAPAMILLAEEEASTIVEVSNFLFRSAALGYGKESSSETKMLFVKRSPQKIYMYMYRTLNVKGTVSLKEFLSTRRGCQNENLKSRIFFLNAPLLFIFNF